MTFTTDGDLPAPLVEIDLDLRNFSYMPLDVLRLRDSGLAACPDAEVFRCAVLSWCVAWHQVPAASLPDDDVVLARLLGFGRDLRGWKRIREAGGLCGWLKCSDGRLYHPVVAEKAREAWTVKAAQRARTEAARKSREEARLRQSQSLSQPLSQSLSQSKKSSVTESKGIEQKGKERKREEGNGLVSPSANASEETLVPPGSRKRPRSPSDPEREAGRAGNIATWDSYRTAYLARYGVEPIRNATVNGQIAQLVKRLGAEDAPQVAAWYLSHNSAWYVQRGHSVATLLSDAEKLHTEWATGRSVTQTQARQIDRKQNNLSVAEALIAESRAKDGTHGI